ncbi:sigma-54 dependent transcriptional regulator [soil metagenome]
MADVPVLAVLVGSDAFAAEWERLAARAGAAARIAGTAAGLAPLSDACVTLVSAGGGEELLPGLVAELRGGGADRVAAVGAADDHRTAVAALNAGAAEYFALPGDVEALRQWVEEGVQRWRAVRRAEQVARQVRRQYDFGQLIGRSPGLQAALERAARIIPRSETTILLTGETGTGKELLARAIHHNGPRGSQPFIEVNCSALPPTLLEAELFGYEPGAFTDARTAKPGLFEAAHGGTLFLDEIGDLQLELQAKLLKVLEDKQVRRLGSVRTTTVDVRIIAATNVELESAVTAGRFRQDLYYRLSVVPIELPPLRERDDDVLLLAEHFLRTFVERYQVTGVRLTNELRRVILGHDWPGNVRELRNAVERAVLLGGGHLHATDLFPRPRQRPLAGVIPFPAPLVEIDRAAAAAMVSLMSGNKKAAAEALEISRTTLYRLLQDKE